jgi:hypothetical protein
VAEPAAAAAFVTASEAEFRTLSQSDDIVICRIGLSVEIQCNRFVFFVCGLVLLSVDFRGV